MGECLDFCCKDDSSSRDCIIKSNKCPVCDVELHSKIRFMLPSEYNEKDDDMFGMMGGGGRRHMRDEPNFMDGDPMN